MGRRRSSMFRKESVGASAMKGLTLGTFGTGHEDEDDDAFLKPLDMDEEIGSGLEEKRRRKTLAKHRRVSMCANALDMALPKRSSVLGGEEGGTGGALSTLTSGLGRMGSIGVGMLKSRFSSLGGGLARLGVPVRVRATADVTEEVRRHTYDIPTPYTDNSVRSVAASDSPAVSNVNKQRPSQAEDSVNMALSPKKREPSESVVAEALEKALPLVLSFLSEVELLSISSLVSNQWWDVSVNCQANLMLVSVGCEDQRAEAKAEGGDDMIDSDSDLDSDDDGDDDDDDEGEEQLGSVALSMRRPWKFLNEKYPWAAFLSEGAFKRVYRVYNSRVGAYEAVSVMDLDLIER